MSIVYKQCNKVWELGDRLKVFRAFEGEVEEVIGFLSNIVERHVAASESEDLGIIVIDRLAGEFENVTKVVISILWDSIAKEVGNAVGRVKRNVVRCCLPGARVKNVTEAVEAGAVNGNDRVVKKIWGG